MTTTWPLPVLIFSVLLSLAKCQTSSPQPYFTGSTIPDPRIDYAACGNTVASFVCDPQGVLTAAQRTQANRNLMSLTTETTQTKFSGCDNKGGIDLLIDLINQASRRT